MYAKTCVICEPACVCIMRILNLTYLNRIRRTDMTIVISFICMINVQPLIFIDCHTFPFIPICRFSFYEFKLFFGTILGALYELEAKYGKIFSR